MNRAYAIWRAFQDRVLTLIAAALLLGCTLLAILEIVRRYVFGVSFEWQQDAVTFFILSGVFLYFGISQRHEAHLTVDVVPAVLNSLGPRAQRAAHVLQAIALALTFVVLVAIVWWGVIEIEDGLRYETRTESLFFPLWPFLAALLLGFAFMAVTAFFQVYYAVQRLRGRAVPEEPTEERGPPH